MSDKILVEATAPGFYGCLREPGDKFEVDVSGDNKNAVSKNWMKPIGDERSAKTVKPDKGQKAE